MNKWPLNASIFISLLTTLKKCFGEFPGGPVVDSVLSLWRAQVWTPVWEQDPISITAKKKKRKKRKCKPQRLFENCVAYLFNKYLQQASYKTKIWMRPSSCPLRNSLKEERHLKCLRGSNVSFGLQQGQGTGTANFLLIRKFPSKQISDTANGTEITEGANWQEILKNVSSSNKQSLKNGMLSGFGPLIIYNTYP